jgi:hypothetical protein
MEGQAEANKYNFLREILVVLVTVLVRRGYVQQVFPELIFFFVEFLFADFLGSQEKYFLIKHLEVFSFGGTAEFASESEVLVAAKLED